MRPRNEYKIRAMMCFVLAGVFLIGTPILHDGLGYTFLGSVFMGIIFAFLFVVIGLYNFNLYQRDKDIEEQNQQRIRDLEKENKKLKERSKE